MGLLITFPKAAIASSSWKSRNDMKAIEVMSYFCSSPSRGFSGVPVKTVPGFGAGVIVGLIVGLFIGMTVPKA